MSSVKYANPDNYVRYATGFFFRYDSIRDGIEYLAYFGEKDINYLENVADILNFNKYKANLKLYRDIEAFENWQDSENFGVK